MNRASLAAVDRLIAEAEKERSPLLHRGPYLSALDRIREALTAADPATSPAYREGWNDRVTGKIFQVFRSVGGDLLHNWPDPLRATDPKWAGNAKAEYVRGWDEAEAAIIALELQ